MSWSNHTNATNFLLKLVIDTAVLLLVLLLFTDAAVIEVIVTGIALTILGYILGDLMVLPRTNNITASIADAILAGLVLWGATAVFGWNMTVSELVTAAIFVAIVEFIFHIRILRTAAGGRRDTSVLS